jgi:hypothetical protein
MTQFDKILGYYHSNEITTFDEWAEAAVKLMSTVETTSFYPTRMKTKYISYTSAYFMGCIRLMVQLVNPEAVISDVGTKGICEISVPMADSLQLATSLDFLLHNLISLSKIAVKAQKRLWREESKSLGLTAKQSKTIGLGAKDYRHIYNSFYHQALEALVKKIQENKN